MFEPAPIVAVEAVSVAPVNTALAVRKAYEHCQNLAKNHYENFPVASLLIPRKQRPAVAAIYAFARTADDFADEAQYEGQRHKRLDEWERLLRSTSPPSHPIFIALADARARFNLPLQLFVDLLTAFRMDVDVKRHARFDSLVNYCRFSANPVGRLVLHLFNAATPANCHLSDAMCTALQLTNFWQDVAIDCKKDRIYIPQDDMLRFGLKEEDIFAGQATPAFRTCMSFQAARTRELFNAGKSLCSDMRGRLGMELRLTWVTATTILKKTERVGFDVFNKRPALTKVDFLKFVPAAYSRQLFARCKT